MSRDDRAGGDLREEFRHSADKRLVGDEQLVKAGVTAMLSIVARRDRAEADAVIAAVRGSGPSGARACACMPRACSREVRSSFAPTRLSTLRLTDSARSLRAS